MIRLPRQKEVTGANAYDRSFRLDGIVEAKGEKAFFPEYMFDFRTKPKEMIIHAKYPK